MLQEHSPVIAEELEEGNWCLGHGGCPLKPFVSRWDAWHRLRERGSSLQVLCLHTEIAHEQQKCSFKCHPVLLWSSMG